MKTKKDGIIQEFQDKPFSTVNAIAKQYDTTRSYVLEVLRDSDIDLEIERVLEYIALKNKYQELSKDYADIVVKFNQLNETHGMLEELFDLQKIFQKKVSDDDLPDMKPERIPMTITSIIGELGEILEEQQAWKDWKENPDDPDLQNLRMEVADLWHFIINLTLYMGMDAYDLYQEFIDKNKVNHKRQNNNY